VTELQKDDSKIKERLQNGENLKNLFLFENKLTSATKGSNDERDSINSLNNLSISIDDDKIVADS
jgi:hypothetical protein